MYNFLYKTILKVEKPKNFLINLINTGTLFLVFKNNHVLFSGLLYFKIQAPVITISILLMVYYLANNL